MLDAVHLPDLLEDDGGVGGDHNLLININLLALAQIIIKGEAVRNRVSHVSLELKGLSISLVLV